MNNFCSLICLGILLLSANLGWANNSSSGDSCENYQSLYFYSAEHVCQEFNEIDKTRDFSISSPECWDDSDFKDTWYRFYNFSLEAIKIISDSEDIALYKGECGDLELVACGSAIIFDPLADQENYLIRTKGEGNFCVGPDISIDSCESTFEIKQSTIFKTFSFLNSTLDEDACNNGDGFDIWFKFIAETTSAYIRPYSYHSDDCNLSIFSGSCSDLNLIDCQENADNFSKRVDDLIVGDEYRIKYSTTDQLNQITFYVDGIPENEKFNNALEMHVDSCHSGSVLFLNADTIKFTLLDTSISNINYPVNEGLWYLFEPTKEVYQLSTTFQEDGRLSIFRKDENGNLVQLLHKYDEYNFGDNKSLDVNVLFKPNSTYYFLAESDESLTFCIKEYKSFQNYEFANAHSLFIDSLDHNKFTFSKDSLVHDLIEFDTLSCIKEKDDASLWFSFETEESKVKLLLSGISSKFQVFETSKISPQIGCPIFESSSNFNFGQSSSFILYDLDPSKKYYVRVYRANSIFDHITSIKTITISIGYPQLNSNNSFDTIEEVEICPPFSCIEPKYDFYTGVNDVSSTLLFEELCFPKSDLLKDVWFTFTATQNNLNLYYESAFNGIAFEVHNFFDSLLVCNQYYIYLEGDDQDQQIVPIEGLKIGETYYLRFIEEYDQSYFSKTSFCIFETIESPLNDKKENAIELISSESLSECNSPEVYHLNSSDNTVWFRFTATDTFHQIVTNSHAENYLGLDAMLFELDANENEIDSFGIKHVDYIINSPEINGDENATWIISLGPNVGFMNFYNLKVDVDYLIKLGYRHNVEDFIIDNEERLPYKYQICLKSSSNLRVNRTINNAKELIPSETIAMLNPGSATFSLIDHPENSSCKLQYQEQDLNKYSDDWFAFKATQNSHTIYAENYATFSQVVDTLIEHAGSKDYLGLNFSLFKKETDSTYYDVVCDISIDSFYALNNLEIDETYYVHIYYNSYNYLTDLDFGIAVSNLTDKDEDGYLSDVDCDDENPKVHPDREEICDGLDNNCDEQIDEGLEQLTFYQDVDGDGFGDINESIIDCLLPNGYVGNNLDCDDTNPEIHPNAQEICDSIDNNCDGVIDEGFPLFSYFVDADGDGFGDIKDSISHCNQPVGYVTNSMDCDDTNPDVYFTAEEICDGYDNNCDGDTDEGFALATYYQDLDEDGFGNPDSLIMYCEQPDGYVVNNEDCDDSDSGINPDQEEIFDNNVDENCDGSITSVSHATLEDLEFLFYPNPTLNEINIEVNKEVDYSVKLYQIDGELILSTENTAKLNVENLSSGLYILKVSVDNVDGLIIKEIIKI